MGWENRLKRLEQFAAQEKAARQEVGLRVAGKSRSEFLAETLTHLFCRLESSAPGVAEILVAAAKSDEQVPSDECEEIQSVLGMIRNCERQNLGLPERILEAVQDGVEAITEDMVFPSGRPLGERGWCYRQGMRFCYQLDAVA